MVHINEERPVKIDKVIKFTRIRSVGLHGRILRVVGGWGCVCGCDMSGGEGLGLVNTLASTGQVDSKSRIQP